MGFVIFKGYGDVLTAPVGIPVLTTPLSELDEGSVVMINENGSPVPFYLAMHDYESELNGAGRTLLVRKDCYVEMAWHSSNINAYGTSNLDAWFNGDYKAMLDEGVQTAIGETSFRYTAGNGSTLVSVCTRSIFAASLTELGITKTGANVEGTALPIAELLKVAYLNGVAVGQWTRTPYTENATSVFFVQSTGSEASTNKGKEYGARPWFTLPSTMEVSEPNADGSVNLVLNNN